MYPQIHLWITGHLYSGPFNNINLPLLVEVAAAVEHELPQESQVESLIMAYTADQDLMLDVVDVLLDILSVLGDEQSVLDLKMILQRRGSVWTVSSDGASLERRVDPTTSNAFSAATTPADQASSDLREAWSKAYGRDPDPSDAWDHAIKAVEAVLGPVISPRNHKATLGTMVRDLNAKPEKWTFGLEGAPGESGVSAFIEMLRLMWPNPDRHSGARTRTPDLAEAQAALQVAVAVVHLVRLGMLK